jgi:hypothetical protein
MGNFQMYNIHHPGFKTSTSLRTALLDYYIASSGNFLPTFQDNVLVHFQVSRIQKKACYQPPNQPKS